MTSRRQFLAVTAACALAPLRASAQSRLVTIGMLSARPLGESFFASNVVRRLSELGYADGKSMKLEFRAAPTLDHYPKLARELDGLKCDLFFAIGPEYAARPLGELGGRTPLVFLAVDYDPVQKGIIASLARPGRNTTGVYIPQAELAAKRLEILRELVPGARRLLVVVDSFSSSQLPAVEKAAKAAGIELVVVEFQRPPYDLDAKFAEAAKAKVDGFVELASPALAANAKTLATVLHRHRIPGAMASVDYVLAGSLLSYGPEPRKVAYRTAELGARVLKGAKAGDIPVEQADQFELVINSGTATALGVKVPERVLARATRIIQ